MSWLAIYNLSNWAIRLVMTLLILRRRFYPATALAWLSVVFFLPVFGLILYLLIGDNRIARRRIRAYRRQLESHRSPQLEDLIAQHAMVSLISENQAPVLRQAEHAGGFPVVGGNVVELISDSEVMVDRLVHDIDEARHHVHLLYYILMPDRTGSRLTEALVRAAKRGVLVRVHADAVGSARLFRSGGMAEQLQHAGVEVRAALPASLVRRRLARIDLRNHRKLAVIDGSVAFMGSQNLVDADYGRRRAGCWLDLTGRFVGPVVTQLQTVFMDDWTFDRDEDFNISQLFPDQPMTGSVLAQAVPTGPSSESAAFPRILLAAVNAARNRVIVTTPYFAPDEPALTAFCMAAERGARVDILVPEHGDHPLVAWAGRALFDPLLDSGVRIHLYPRHHGLIHAKTFTVDDDFALLGSPNLDMRSFYLNFELAVMLYGSDITAKLRYAQTAYLEHGVKIDAATWRRRPAWKRYAQSAAALFTPML